MVLQAGAPLRVFGEGEGTVSVSFRGVRAEAEAADGKWTVILPPQPYGEGEALTVSCKEASVTLHDVCVGDVFILGGQSNMQFKLKESKTDTAVFADNALVRLFSMDRIEASDRFRPGDGWKSCTQKDAPDWSAIGYFFGNFLQEKTGHAVGMITCYQGASIIESWMSPEALADLRFDLPVSEKHIDHTYEIYKGWNANSVLYDFAVKAIAPYTVKRVLWYQGESDTSVSEARIYRDELAAMIACWRKVFLQPELPFSVVVIADYDPRRDDGWRLVQEAQMHSDEIPGVTVVTSADVCESDNIHPATKSRLAKKLVESAR